MSDVLRHGRTNLTTLYLQNGDVPVSAKDPDGDVFLGHARTAEYAEIACAAMNGTATARNPKWWCSGGLVYDRQGASLTRGWIIALSSKDPDCEEMAARIVAAVRGEVAQ